VGKYSKKALKILQKEYKQCPHCNKSTSDAYLCESCNHMHCTHCHTKMTRISSLIAEKARLERSDESFNKDVIFKTPASGKKLRVKKYTSESYQEIMRRTRQNMIDIYSQFANIKPIVLYNVQDHSIYVYPYNEFRTKLSEESRQSVPLQYIEALTNNHFLVFVRHNKNDLLLSYTLPIDGDKSS
jgi:hypothetical protein